MKCEEAVLNAVRHGDPKIIQVGCITLWNLGLPLLQKNLRKNLRKPLQVIALALEDIKRLVMCINPPNCHQAINGAKYGTSSHFFNLLVKVNFFLTL